MIVVRVEIHKGGYGGEVVELARAEIANVGGTETHGNYICRTLFGRSRKAGVGSSDLPQFNTRRQHRRVLGDLHRAVPIWG